MGLALTLPLMCSLCACSDNDKPDFPGPGVDDPADLIVDLSEEEMANCYIVQTAGTYRFRADNRFNLGPGLPLPPVISPESAALVWQSVPGSVASVDLVEVEGEDCPYIEFEVAEATGNALIAALDAEGNIAWSWHIWMPETEIESVATATGYEVMNLNLGAMNNTPGNVGSYGLLYQWGRKDPFPAAPTLTGDTQTVGAPLYDIDGNPVGVVNSSWYDNSDNTLAYSIAHPTTVLSNFAQYSTSRDWLKAGEGDDSLWGNPKGDSRDGANGSFVNKGKKTCYDPSPAGWRVAPADAFINLTFTGGYAWYFEDFNIYDSNGDGVANLKDYNCGWHFLVADDTPLYFPAAARYDGSYAMLMGSVSGIWGNYWSNSPYSTVTGGALCGLSFQVKGQNGEEWITVSPAGGASRADAYSIRCVRDR